MNISADNAVQRVTAELHLQKKATRLGAPEPALASEGNLLASTNALGDTHAQRAVMGRHVSLVGQFGHTQ
jgi:hypothetical protein